MNLLLHGVHAPRIDSGNALHHRLTEIGEEQRVDVILTDPPFGGEEEAGILNNLGKAVGHLPKVLRAGIGKATEIRKLSLGALADAAAADRTVTVSIPSSSTGSAPKLTAKGLGGGAAGARTGDGQITLDDSTSQAVATVDPALVAKASVRPRSAFPRAPTSPTR